jgi:sentrin-specific protease 7
MDGILDGSVPGCFTLLQCRTVRLGSYKVVPKDRVLISSVGIRIAVPAIEDGEYLRAIFITDFY